MGYFLQKFGIVINEAEVDGQEQEASDTNTDYSATEDTNNETENNNQDNENTEENSTDENNTENQDNNEDTPDENTEDDNTDYTEGDDGLGDDTDGGDDGNTDGNDTNDNNSDNGGDQPVDDLKKQEEEIYSSANLTPEQLDIKHKDLKRNYLYMYDITTGIIDRIGDIGINTTNVKVVEYISDQLTKLRSMISDYVNNIYASKSYIENAVNYNRFLAVLNGINKMLEELGKSIDK